MATPEGGVRYAPEDPSIPKPWKGLIDDKTGFLYYWNPESNVTQYDKPVPLPNASSAVSYQPLSSSVQNSQGRHIDNDDPSIPKPWKGLIDPKTGFLYYWNPESNATQYEKPAAVSNPSAALSNTSSALSNKPWNPQSNATPHEKPVAVSNSSSALSYPPLSSPVEKFSHERHSDLDDPSLPKPWKGLIDPKTGFLYYWNPESNATQYEKPAALTNPSSALSYKPWNPESNASQYEKPAALSDTSSALSYQPLNSSVQKFSQGCPINNDGPSIPKPWKGSTDDKTGFLNYRNPESNATPYDKPAALSNASSALSYQPWNPVSNSTQYGKPAAFSNANSAPPYRPLSSSVPNFSQGRHVDNDDDYKFVNAGINGHTMAARSKSGFSPVDSNVRMIGAESSVSAESYRRRHEISVTGDNVPQPFSSFESTGFPLELLREAQLAGFSAPTPIQAQSWPIAIQGRDIVAIAKTGSGKTLGYLIPAFLHLKHKRSNPKLGPTVLVLSPTRELATQIQAEAFKFGRSSNISCTCLYGGAPKGPQLAELERGVDVVVATPGRLNDILEMRRISLHQVSYLVLDEADRMLDMGFEPQIRKIMNGVPSRRQTLLYTATWPKEVRKIAADLLINPVQVNIGNVDELVANKSITQYVEVLSPMDKRRRLEQILRSQEPGSKVIIFCSTKRMCDQLAGHLSRQFGAAAIHGDKSQGDRDYILNQFRNGRSPVLVATDVAARGLDIKDIRVVVNFDFPNGVEDYVHRIGRTGRAGATGVSFTFLGDQDAKHASDLVKLLEGANQVVPNEVRAMVSRAVGMGIGKRQWGSGPGGRGGRDGGFGGGRDGGFGGGRDGGRGGFGGGGRGMPSSFDRGVSHGFDRPQQSRDRYGSSIGPGANTNGRFHHNSFTETTAPRKRARSRSRSPRRSSRSRSQSRSRSRSRIRSRSRSRSRSRIRSRSLIRSRSRSLIRSRSRSYSPSPERFNGAGPTRPVGPGPGP